MTLPTVIVVVPVRVELCRPRLADEVTAALERLHDALEHMSEAA